MAGSSGRRSADGELMDFTNDGPKVLTEDPWRERLDLVESIVTSLT